MALALRQIDAQDAGTVDGSVLLSAVPVGQPSAIIGCGLG